MKAVASNRQATAAKPLPRKQAATLRTIAPLPFKSTLSAKVVDAAIKKAMAARSPDVQQAVRVAGAEEPVRRGTAAGRRAPRLAAR